MKEKLFIVLAALLSLVLTVEFFVESALLDGYDRVYIWCVKSHPVQKMKVAYSFVTYIITGIIGDVFYILRLIYTNIKKGGELRNELIGECKRCTYELAYIRV